ncbi:flap endonuclease-1 [Candidatus Woesearchaeota archaeon]|nr:flap endonuclease-1 [Candidatus Woesearchaeota archaeon]
MGVNFKDLVVKRDISIQDFGGRKLVVDGNNILYQFLSNIRQPDGTPLKDSEGNITSHLNGLFHRYTKLMQQNIKMAFVFDGKAPDLKQKERDRRYALKKDAEDSYTKAKETGDVDAMKKYSMRTSRLTKEMIDEAALLIGALGMPVVMAPSEGEAQAAYMVKKGDVYAEVSQDYDCLLFGVPRMVQNLTISERRKRKNKLSYETVKPQMIELAPTLESMGITRDQLIALGILVGTDFNVGGIKGIGPKKAIELIQKHGDDFESLFQSVNWNESFDYPWKDVFNLFTKMPVKSDYKMEWSGVDRDRVLEVLCEKHGFSSQRVEDTLDKLNKAKSLSSQKGLGDFI